MEENMLSNKSIILLTLLIVASALSAWSITDTYFGNRYGTLDARMSAMGGAGTYNDSRAFGIADNPANLTLMKNNLGISVNTYMARNEDNRSFPLYNSFDNYVDDSVYSSNINFYNNFAAAAYYNYRMDMLGVGRGACYKPLLSFDGNYTEEIRNNRNTDNDGYPEKIAQNMIEGRGTLNQTGITMSTSFDTGDILSANLGISLAMLNGDITRDKTIRWSDYAKNAVGAFHLPELTETSDYELSGNQIKIGAAVRVNSRFGIAMTHTMKSTLDKEGTYYYKRDAYTPANNITVAADSTNMPVNEDYILPSEFRVGFSYFPRNVMRTVFNMDLEYVMHSDIDKRYDDVVNLYAGVEHHIANRIPFRLGFQAVNSYFFTTEAGVDAGNNPITLYPVSKILSPMITAGSSIDIMKGLTMDLGFGYTWREYEATDLFGDAYYNDKLYTGSSAYVLWPNSHLTLQNRGWENPDKIRENNITVNAGLNFVW